jgi:DNA-binding MarR family transcriptional regulator
VLRVARTRHAGRFLKGPIPLNDITVASRLPGRALAVFLAIHHRVALTRNPEVTLPKRLLAELGVTRDGKARALHALEAAGLARVERQHGRSPKIRLTTQRQTKRRP